MFKTELVTVVTYHQMTEAVGTDVVLQEGAPETCCVAPSGADVDSIDAEQRCVCVWGGGDQALGLSSVQATNPKENRGERGIPDR